MNSLLTATADFALTVLVPLTDEVPEAEDVNTGWWYVLVFFGLIAATLLLWLSMRKRLKNIRFDENPPREVERDGEDPGATQ
jgi:Na+/melibiose symporter-like transporter